jgi:hypothetical protein
VGEFCGPTKQGGETRDKTEIHNRHINATIKIRYFSYHLFVIFHAAVAFKKKSIHVILSHNDALLRVTVTDP